MSAVTLLFLALSLLSVFVVAAVVIGREAHRVDGVAPRVVYDIDEATSYVADRLPPNSQARLTYEELKKRLSSVLGAKNVRMDEEVESEEEYTRGSVKDLDEDLRSELNNLQPTRRAAAPMEDEDDDALSYFSRLANE